MTESEFIALPPLPNHRFLKELLRERAAVVERRWRSIVIAVDTAYSLKDGIDYSEITADIARGTR